MHQVVEVEEDTWIVSVQLCHNIMHADMVKSYTTGMLHDVCIYIPLLLGIFVTRLLQVCYNLVITMLLVDNLVTSLSQP